MQPTFFNGSANFRQYKIKEAFFEFYSSFCSVSGFSSVSSNTYLL